MSATDFSQPLAALLRDSTHAAHDKVAHSPGAKRLLSGELSKQEYTRYLMLLWHVYSTFEAALDRHAAHPSLEPTYNPALLARAPALSADISYLLQTDDWKSHPLHKSLWDSKPVFLDAYINRINQVANLPDPSALLAHSYVRYLGDLSGGQVVRHTIAKAYDLDEAAGFGVSFYSFKELRSTKPASLGEMKRIKDWFREGLNTAGERDVNIKVNVVEEANTAFTLNSDLFELLDLNNTNSLEEEQVEAPVSKPSGLTEQAWPLSSVAAVIAAVCLAHFVLVTGGFTGNKGYQKLLAIEEWLRGYFQSSATD